MSKERIVLTYKDVISGEAKKYIGKPGVFCDFLYEYNKSPFYSGTLDGFNHANLSFPFVCSALGCYQFFLPDQEPEHKHVPFTFDDAPMFRDNWIKINNEFSRVQNYDAEGVYLFVHGIVTFISYLDLVLKGRLEDGTPCGKKLEIE